jgi:outer membrane lipoprotein-sorting protein
MLRQWITFFIFAAPSLVWAAPSAKEVDAVLASYRKAKALHAKVNKTVEQETMGTTMKSQGEFFFSKGKLRLEMREPERTVLVYDGKIVWFESRTDDDHIIVSRIKSADLRRSNSLLAALFDKKDVLNSFILKSGKKVDGVAKYHFEAKDKKNSDVQVLDLAIKDKDIQSISYQDQILNRVTLEFIDMTRGKVDADKFAYKAPKKAEVQNL